MPKLPAPKIIPNLKGSTLAIAEVGAEQVRVIQSLRLLHDITRIIYEQAALEDCLVADPGEDALRRSHAFGYRRILAVMKPHLQRPLKLKKRKSKPKTTLVQ
jgi:hypothetical protein